MDLKDQGSLHAIRRSARLNHIHPTGGLTEKSPSYKFLVARSLSPQPVSWRLKEKIRGEQLRFWVETMVPSKLSLKQSYWESYGDLMISVVMVRVFSISYKMPLNAHPIYIYKSWKNGCHIFRHDAYSNPKKNKQKSWKMSRFAGMNLLRSPC